MEFLLIVLAYLLGSVPTGYLLGRMAGIDVRQAGSGNVGATNVARVVGKSQGVLTLAADAAKGFIPMILAVQLGFSSLATALAAAAVFLGHLYPVFLRFKGGKGVATAFGVFLGLAPAAALVLIVIFTTVVLSTRIVSLGSIVTAAAAPLALWWFAYAPILVAMSAFLSLMIILRHRTNIQRLLTGTEPKFGS